MSVASGLLGSALRRSNSLPLPPSWLVRPGAGVVRPLERNGIVWGLVQRALVWRLAIHGLLALSRRLVARRGLRQRDPEAAAPAEPHSCGSRSTELPQDERGV